MNAEHGYGDGDGELKIVARGGEGEGCRFRIVGPETVSKVEGEKKHQDEVDKKGHRNLKNIEGERDDVLALQGKHKNNGEEEGDQGDGANGG